MDVHELTDFIREKWSDFNNAERLDFKDYVKRNPWGPISAQLEYTGVYVVYEGNKPIYVGSAGKGERPLKYRIADLFCYSSDSESDPFYHTLTEKLVKEKNMEDTQKALDEVREFYCEKCSFKVIKTGTVDLARMLEQVLIVLLGHPKYND
ncbi:MAG: hypothetical protein ACOC6H_03840 [Thermoproteota archaeon]